MSFGPYSVFSVSLASGVTGGSAMDLGRSWKNMFLQVPVMASGSVFIKVSPTLSGTYNRIMIDNKNTATVQQTFVINSSITQSIVPIPAGYRYMKVENSSGCTDVVTVYNVICSD